LSVVPVKQLALTGLFPFWFVTKSSALAIRASGSVTG